MVHVPAEDVRSNSVIDDVASLARGGVPTSLTPGPDEFWRALESAPHSHRHLRSLDMASFMSEETSNGHDVRSCDNRASGLVGDRGAVEGYKRGRPGRGDASVPRAASVRRWAWPHELSEPGLPMCWGSARLLSLRVCEKAGAVERFYRALNQHYLSYNRLMGVHGVHPHSKFEVNSVDERQTKPAPSIAITVVSK